MPHQVAIDVEPGFAEQAGKTNVERLAGLGFAYLDIRAIPDKAIVLAAIGRSNSLDFHVEVGAQRSPRRQVEIGTAPVLVQAGVVRVRAEGPFERELLH